MAKIKILLVDDEIDHLKVIGRRIIDWGYDLIEAVNGEEAIKALKTKNPDIVILDYMLPAMDGIATLEEIRKINNDMPVIMFTAHPEIKAIKDAERLKVRAFIPKLNLDSGIQSSLKTANNVIDKGFGKGA
jgi:CheY-like chemotaxis protein